MALTSSRMELGLGTEAPSFTLLNTVNDETVTYSELKSNRANVVIFMCNHCPFVKHIISRFVEIAKEYQAKGVSFIAISSNDAKHYPADSPEKMKLFAIEKEFTFPYLHDETQAVAKAYKAACTPDLFVFDGQSKLVYCGRFDKSTPGNNMPVTGDSLTTVLDEVLQNKNVSQEQYPSQGCNIKWRENSSA